MSAAENQPAKSPVSHLHVVNLVVALLAGIISIAGGIYSLKSNLFSGPSYGSVQGIVRDEKIARPLYLTQVEISGIDGAVVNTVTTDMDGRYLVETLKAGNYVVKFTAPRHAVQTKTVKIEKDLKSSIDVDLVPEPEPVKTIPATSEVVPSMNPAPVYPAATVAGTGSATTPASSYAAPSGNTYNAQTASTAYPQQSYGQGTDADFSEPQRSGPSYPRRGPRGSYGRPPMGSDSSQSQGSALAEVGTQLLQGLLTKKAENS